MLSIICGVTLSILLNPKPQRLMSGAQVISYIPFVLDDTSLALRKTSAKRVSTSTSLFRLTCEMMESESVEGMVISFQFGVYLVIERFCILVEDAVRCM